MTAIQAIILSFSFCVGNGSLYIFDGWNADHEKRNLLMRRWIDRTVAQILALSAAAILF